MEQRKRKHQRLWRLSSILGIIAPVMFASLVLGLGALQRGFNHMTDMMSELGGVGGIRGNAFLVGGALAGLMIIVFAMGLHEGIDGGRGSRIGPILLALGGVGMIGSALFHCSAGCKNVLVNPILSGRLHILFAFITGSCMAIAPLVIFSRLKDHDWRQLRLFTLISGILANIPGLILWISFFTTRLPAWEGLIQRLGLLFPLVWIVGMSLNLYRREAAGTD